MGFGGGTSGNSSISGSNDVALNNVTDNQVLGYDSGTSKWTNVTVSGGGASGPSGATVVVAANDAPSGVKAGANFVCDGTADEVQINQAIASIASDAISLGGQGGTVLLWGKSFNVAGPILMRSQVTLTGQGQWGTVIRPAASYTPGEQGGVIELYSTNTQYTTVSNLAIHGNASAGARSCGIFYQQGAGVEWDASHRLMDLYIYATGWHGIYLTYTGSSARNRAFYLSNIRIIDAGTTVSSTANGVYIDSPDSFLIGIDVGSSASHGFRVTGANNRFVACKAWYSGSLATAAHQGSGFYISGGTRNQLSGCEAQDNFGDGFYIGGGNQSLSACTADSNGYNRDGGAGAGVGWTGSGFYIASGGMNIHGNAMDKNEGSRGIYQKHGVETAYSGIKAIVNVVVDVSGVSSQGGSAFSGTSVINVI